MDKSKVEAILSWPTPRSTTKVRSFHGLAQFYRNFVRRFSEICARMNATIKGCMKEKFTWTKIQYERFERLKKEMKTKLVLVLPSFEKFFVVECDTSNIEPGLVLSQEGRHVAFFSEKINEAKTRYSTYDFELYALVQALKKWRHYLLPKEFYIFKENQVLIFFNSSLVLDISNG